MKLKDKVQAALDSLEMKMKRQSHLNAELADSVLEDIEFLVKMNSMLTDDERDFLNAVKFTVKAQMRWE